MIEEDELVSVLVAGRSEAYVKKNRDYNPYVRSLLYDWEFRLRTGSLLYTDSFRGFNPYGGVEYVFENGCSGPLWSADYVGYAVTGMPVSPEEIFAFLREARGSHLASGGGAFLAGYEYRRGLFLYRSVFEGDFGGLFQTEECLYDGRPAARQLTSGRYRHSPA